MNLLNFSTLFCTRLSSILSYRTKCPHRLNQGFGRSPHLLIDENDKSDINFSNDVHPSSKNVRIDEDSSPIHLPKTQSHRKRVIGTYGVIAFSRTLRSGQLTPKSDTQFFTPILSTHNLLRFSERKIRGFSVSHFTQKSASPAGVPRGCFYAERHGCREAVQPPWKTKSLARFSFINPLRYASIANATTGLIQAKILHSPSRIFRDV